VLDLRARGCVGAWVWVGARAGGYRKSSTPNRERQDDSRKASTPNREKQEDSRKSGTPEG